MAEYKSTNVILNKIEKDNDIELRSKEFLTKTIVYFKNFEFIKIKYKILKMEDCCILSDSTISEYLKLPKSEKCEIFNFSKQTTMKTMKTIKKAS